MRAAILALAAGLLAAGGLTACGSGRGEQAAPVRPPRIGVILPDSRSAARWEAVDRPTFQAALTSAGIPFAIQNAQGDPTAFRAIADQMIADGTTVLLTTSVDGASGRAVLDSARAHHVTTIDYDRLTLGGGADYFVGFDNVQAGRLLAQGLTRCLADRGVTRPVVAQLSGPLTDYNTVLLRQGYLSVLNPGFRSGQYVKGPDEAVPGRDGDRAGAVFQQMLDSTDHLDGVVTTSDTLASAAIAVLGRRDLAGAVPVTGQDATIDGLRQVLAGAQCLTIYRPARKEATAAADLAVSLARGARTSPSARIADPQGRHPVPAVLLAPQPVVRATVKDLVTAGAVSAADLCAPDHIVQCRDAGIR